MPVFAELRPFLIEAIEYAEGRQEYLIGGDYRDKANTSQGWRGVNLRKPLMALIAKREIYAFTRFHKFRHVATKYNKTEGKGFEVWRIRLAI